MMEFVDEHGHVIITPDDDRLESLAEFAAGAGHEINNPLATIVGRASLLLKGEADPDRRQSLGIIGAQALRVRDMIGDLMLFARPPAPVLVKTELQTLCKHVIEKLHGGTFRQSPPIQQSVATGEIFCDVTQFSVLLSSILQNALEASRDSEVPVELCAHRDVKSWKIEVINHGKGWSETERRHAFDPFFSGRQAGRGLGFGLCKAWQIARMHRARIWIEVFPKNITKVHVEWPDFSE